MISKDILKGLINEGDTVLIGVSGGADSMCLLSIMQDYLSVVNYDLYVVHVNHNIRDEEAKRDQDFVADYCNKNNLKYEIINVYAKDEATKENKTLEQVARDLRYKTFNEVAKKIKANKIAVAHHMMDQAETVLMHIFRGSAISGAIGMRSRSGVLIRPLINFSKQEILSYLKKNGVTYIEDSSNNDVKYTRNYIRKKVFPTIQKVYPNISSALCEFSKKCERDEDFIQGLLPLDLIQKRKDMVSFPVSVCKMHKSISTRLVKKAIEQLNIFSDIEEKHILQILDFNKAKSGSEIHLPNGLIVYKDYDKLTLKVNNDKVSCVENYAFKEGIISFKEFGDITVSKINKLEDVEFIKGIHYLDESKIPANAIWRFKKTGDKFSKFGSGTKSLADYFTDKKVVKRERDKIPVLASCDKILVVAGMDISDNVKIDKTTTQIIKIEYK